LAQLLPEDGVF